MILYPYRIAEALMQNGDVNSSVRNYQKAVDLAVSTNNRDVELFRENLEKAKLKAKQ